MTTGKVIVCTLEPPDPFGNAAARWYYVLVKGLAERGYRVHCLSTFTKPAEAKRAQERLADTAVDLCLYPVAHGSRGLRGKWATWQRPYSYSLSDQLHQDVARECRDGYDILHLEQMQAGYLGAERDRALLSVHHLKILDLAEERAQSASSALTKYFFGRMERMVPRSFNHIRVTTDRLAHEVGRLNPRAQLYTVPIALDPELYEPVVSSASAPTVGLIGSMNWDLGYRAAVRLITRIWPQIRRQLPAARLIIGGWQAGERLAAWRDEPGLTILSDIPHPHMFFEQIDVLNYPLSVGSGMKVKLLETMAYGIPVVTTPEGIEGIAAELGVDAFVDADDHCLADMTVELLRDSERCQRMGMAGRRLIETRYGPDATVSQTEAMYEAMLTKANERRIA